MPAPNIATPESARADQDQYAGELIANGSAAAAILSAGAASCALGILAVIADGSKTAGRWLAFYRPSGPLSGVTTVTILVWFRDMVRPGKAVAESQRQSYENERVGLFPVGVRPSAHVPAVR